MKKRLFIFAAYAPDGVIGGSLLYYLNTISKLGDIIFIMDNDISASEMSKLDSISNIIHACAVRHGEYDFGSYKRGYLYAYNKNILEKYDWIYFVNDSVYGPIYDMYPILNNLENRNLDFIGMVRNQSKKHKIPKHIQSWFFALSRKCAMSKYVYDFLLSVQHENNKQDIIHKYEIGMTQMLAAHGNRYDTAFYHNDDIQNMMYCYPYVMLKLGLPFIKKAAVPYMFNEKNLVKTIRDKKLLDEILCENYHNNVKYINKVKERIIAYFMDILVNVFGIKHFIKNTKHSHNG